MEGIPTGLLRAEGGFGISRILDFSMNEYPGMHSHATVTGNAELTSDGRWGFEGVIGKSPVEIYVAGERKPLYTGIIQEAESREENGVHVASLSLSSGSILLDMEKKSHSFQDAGMTYGQVISQVMAQSGAAAVYPNGFDALPIGFPVIQYQETDWEFAGRLASRFGLPLYPESGMGGPKVCMGIPYTGRTCRMSVIDYTARVDRRFYAMGGEAAGRSRVQYLTYEVRSWEDRQVGDQVMFQGKPLYICAKSCRVKGGHLEFTYVLSHPDWAGVRRSCNRKISGMSLLGTVLQCAGETVKLKLDIDEQHPDQNGANAYPWTWVPATGNVMYMMPQAGTRVSLYFKNEEEESAIAVNCIRSGNGCAGADYRDKTLTTEHGKQMKLCQCDMGFIALNHKVMLDDMSGIQMVGKKGLHILAVGAVSIEAKEVSLSGAAGVVAYDGTVQMTEGSPPEVIVKAKVELSGGEDSDEIHSRGEGVTYYLAWEHGDLSNPGYRYRDAPEQKDYDWGKLGVNVAGGLVMVSGIALLAATGVGAAVEAGVIPSAAIGGMSAGGAAKAMAISTAITGGLYVGSQAVADIASGRVSNAEAYMRKAMAGSVVGILTGATGLLMPGASLGKTISMGFGEGFVGSAGSQWIIDGEIDWNRAIAEGAFSAIASGAMWGWRTSHVEGGSGALKVTGELPQGISEENFNRGSQLIRERVGDVSDNIVVQGSRASGTAKPTSDIDIAIRVTPDKFDELIQKSFRSPNPGSAKERTMLHAIETGKIQAGEAGLRGLRKELEQIFGMEVDISIIKESGAFDNPPFIPIKN